MPHYQTLTSLIFFPLQCLPRFSDVYDFIFYEASSLNLRTLRKKILVSTLVGLLDWIVHYRIGCGYLDIAWKGRPLFSSVYNRVVKAPAYLQSWLSSPVTVRPRLSGTSTWRKPLYLIDSGCSYIYALVCPFFLSFRVCARICREDMIRCDTSTEEIAFTLLTWRCMKSLFLILGRHGKRLISPSAIKWKKTRTTFFHPPKKWESSWRRRRVRVLLIQCVSFSFEHVKRLFFSLRLTLE